MLKTLAHSLETQARTEDVIINQKITFEALLLPQNILEGLTEAGFKKPSPIQLKAIPIARCGFDVLVKAKSGTGKTLVFGIISLEALDTSKNAVQVLILAPTREIAVQIQEVIQTIGKHIEGLRVDSFIGGIPVNSDKEKISTCHIAVGTPGRIKHLINDNLLKVNHTHLLVLDEADKLLESSFSNDINEIYNKLPVKKQIITASATYPNELEKFLSEYMLSPSCISTEKDSPLLLGIKQFVVVKLSPSLALQTKQKKDELINIFSKIAFTQCLVFFNVQSKAESISNILNQSDWNTAYISAALPQAKRLKIIQDLKEFKHRILLATDLTSRGIDAANVDLIINYDIPIDPMTYLHRMGRAGRYGSSGACINLVSSEEELNRLKNILGCVGGSELQIPELPDFIGTVSELLQVEISPEKFMSGSVPECTKIDLRDNVIHMKKRKKSSMEGRKSTDRKKSTSNEIINILNEARNEVEEVKKQISDMDGQSILETLAAGSYTLEPQVKSDKQSDYTLETPLYESTSSTNSNENHNFKKQKLEETFVSNKALLDVTKILSETTNPAGNDSIRQYLSILKNKEQEEISRSALKDIPDILDQLKNVDRLTVDDCIPATCEKHDLPATCEKNDLDMENIFKFGYECVIKETKDDWKNLLSSFVEKESSEDEVEIPNASSSTAEEKQVEIMKWIPVEPSERLGTKKKQTPIWVAAGLPEKNSSESENDRFVTRRKQKHLRRTSEASKNDIPMNRSKRYTSKKKQKPILVSDETSLASGNEENDDLIKWLPFEHSRNKSVEQYAYRNAQSEIDSYEGYESYFNLCSEELWQNGLNFRDWSRFDEWYFYEWQAQLNAVRSYVQQNIYVKEMAKFQRMQRENSS